MYILLKIKQLKEVVIIEHLTNKREKMQEMVVIYKYINLGGYFDY